MLESNTERTVDEQVPTLLTSKRGQNEINSHRLLLFVIGNDDLRLVRVVPKQPVREPAGRWNRRDGTVREKVVEIAHIERKHA